VLEAAMTLFARHGFQRTSMADVAMEAAVSRATLYLRFCDKRSLFEALADTMVTNALTASEAAWDPNAELAENLEATVLARDLPLYRVLHASPHGAELLAVDAESTRAHAERLDAGFAALLAMRANTAALGGADLSAFDGPDGFSRFLATTAAGLKHEARTEAAYRDAVHRLCIVTARAMTR
jgi:AcrR family transcriptional regulator